MSTILALDKVNPNTDICYKTVEQLHKERFVFFWVLLLSSPIHEAKARHTRKTFTGRDSPFHSRPRLEPDWRLWHWAEYIIWPKRGVWLGWACSTPSLSLLWRVTTSRTGDWTRASAVHASVFPSPGGTLVRESATLFSALGWGWQPGRQMGTTTALFTEKGKINITYQCLGKIWGNWASPPPPLAVYSVVVCNWYAIYCHVGGGRGEGVWEPTI